MISIQQSGVHMETHLALKKLLGPEPSVIEQDTAAGEALQQRIHEHYQANKGENTDIGIEMDHRHKSGVYPYPSDDDGLEPRWSADQYVPSTYVGSRAPHVYLKDGSAIFDHYGEFWTLFEFIQGDTTSTQSQPLISAAEEIKMPLKHVVLRDENHARRIWEKAFVLVRPDGHVAWRGDKIHDTGLIQQVVSVVAGHKPRSSTEKASSQNGAFKAPFAATEEVTKQIDDYQLDQMGIMQT